MRNYVQAARTSKRMSQRRLADIVGLAPTTISNLEAHRYDVAIETKTRILKALGIPLSRYRIVFPDLPFEPSDISMPTGDEIAEAQEKRRLQRLGYDRDRRRRQRLWRDQDADRDRV